MKIIRLPEKARVRTLKKRTTFWWLLCSPVTKVICEVLVFWTQDE